MRLTASLTVYVGAILAANLLTTHYGLVPVGLGMLVTAGTFAAGFALLARDLVQRDGGIRWAFGAIAVGGLLSWLLADPFIALASVVAFTAAELIDLAVFTPIRPHGFVRAALASNIVSAPIDTVIFLWIAGFGVTANAVGGQFIGKVIWATVLPLALYVGGRRAFLRQPINTTGA